MSTKKPSTAPGPVEKLREKAVNLQRELSILLLDESAESEGSAAYKRAMKLMSQIEGLNARIEAAANPGSPKPEGVAALRVAANLQPPLDPPPVIAIRKAPFHTEGVVDGDTFMREYADRIRDALAGVTISRRMEVRGRTPFKGKVLYVEILVFEPGGILELADAAATDNGFIVVRCRDLVIQDMDAPGEIMHPEIPRVMGRRGLDGVDAPNFDRFTRKGKGRKGLNGTDGFPGGSPEDRGKVPTIFLIAERVVSDRERPALQLTLKGWPGGVGGSGGNGGRGGDGERGTEGTGGFFQGCFGAKPPGRGGNGGNGGFGGPAARGQSGGAGADIYLVGLPQAVFASFGFRIDNDGGPAGFHGSPGTGNNPGEPGTVCKLPSRPLIPLSPKGLWA